jgi:hypothetical protein
MTLPTLIDRALTRLFDSPESDAKKKKKKRKDACINQS